MFRVDEVTLDMINHKATITKETEIGTHDSKEHDLVRIGKDLWIGKKFGVLKRLGKEDAEMITLIRGMFPIA